MKKYSDKIIKAAKKIKLIATDIDGVLTAGEVILLENGEEVKIWNVKDRAAVSYVKRYLPEIKIAWISGRKSKQVELRAKELKIDFLMQACGDKKKILFETAAALKIKTDEIAYIGDDIIDIGALKNAGFSVCPDDAVEDVKKYADFVSSRGGGKGVFREVCEIILKSKNMWNKVLNSYL